MQIAVAAKYLKLIYVGWSFMRHPNMKTTDNNKRGDILRVTGRRL